MHHSSEYVDTHVKCVTEQRVVRRGSPVGLFSCWCVVLPVCEGPLPVLYFCFISVRAERPAITMPPSATSCAACKACKTKCEGFSPGTPCRRCSRLDLRCDPAPQKIQKRHAFMRSSASCAAEQQHHGSAPIVASTSDSHASTALVGSTSGDVSVGMTTSDAHIMQALDNRDDEIFCLRHMAQIARKRGNAYGLMDRVLRECRKKGLDLDAVLTPPSGDGGSGGDDEPGRSAHPIEILEVVNASAGYCQRARPARAARVRSFRTLPSKCMCYLSTRSTRRTNATMPS